MIICQKCGTTFDEAFGLCPHCGTACQPLQPSPHSQHTAKGISSPVAQTVSPSSPVPIPTSPSGFPADMTNHISSVPPKSKNTKKGKLIVIIAIVCAVLIAAAVTLILVFSQKSGSNELDTQISLGEKYLLEENYDEAIKALKKAIEIDPNNPDLYLRLSEAYVGKGDYDSAVQTLEDALTKLESETLRQKLEELKQEKNYRELLQKGDAAKEEKNYHVAAGYYEQAAEIKPKEELPYLSAAENYLEADETDSAIEILEKGYEETNSQTIKDELEKIEKDTVYDYASYITTTKLKGKLFNNEKEFDIPQFSIPGSTETDAVNETIRSKFELNSHGEIVYVPSYEIHGYQNVLSLVVKADLSGIGLNHNYCYHFDLKTKKQLTNSELLSYSGITEEELNQDLNSMLAYAYCKIYHQETDANGNVTKKGMDYDYINQQYFDSGFRYMTYPGINTDIPENVQKKYINENGDLYLSFGNGLADYIEFFFSYQEFRTARNAANASESSSEPSADGWKTAYQEKIHEFIEKNQSMVDSGSAKFELLDIDSDGIPELFLSEGILHILKCQCYSYVNGSLTEGPSGIYGILRVCQEQGLLYTESGGMGGWYYTYYQKDASGFARKESLFTSAGSGNERYTIDDKEVTKGEYETEKAVFDAMKWYEAGRKCDLNETTIDTELAKW